MRIIKRHRILAIFCAFVLLFSTFSTPVAAETPEEKYERLKNELAVIAGEIDEAKNDRAKAEELRASLEREKQLIDELITINKDDITATREELDALEEAIAQKREEILEYDQLFQQRVVAIYKMNTANALSALLSVDSFSEFLQVIDALQRISVHDNYLLDTMASQKATLEAQQTIIDATLNKLDDTYTELSDNTQALAANIMAQDSVISQTDAELRAKEIAYGDTAEAAEQAYQEMLALSNSVAGMGSSPGDTPAEQPASSSSPPASSSQPEPPPVQSEPPASSSSEQSEQPVQSGDLAPPSQSEAPANSSASAPAPEPPAPTEPEPEPEPEPAPTPPASGVYLWPVPASRRITCYFGSPDPNGNAHLGMDIGAPTGTPIVAAGTGTVIVATYHSSYGNYLVVDHGNGLKTLYAHCNSLLVGTGAAVNAGDTIATVGSTGFSTGPHLHFEVHDPGRQNPLNYVG